MKKSNCYLSIFLNDSHGSEQTNDAHILCLAYRHVAVMEWYYAFLQDGISVSVGQTWQGSFSFHRLLGLSGKYNFTNSVMIFSLSATHYWKAWVTWTVSNSWDIYNNFRNHKSHPSHWIVAQLQDLTQGDAIWRPSIIPAWFLIIWKVKNYQSCFSISAHRKSSLVSSHLYFIYPDCCIMYLEDQRKYRRTEGINMSSYGI